MKRFLVALAIIFSTCSLVAVPASAYNPLGSPNCSGTAANSAICQDRNKTTNPVTGSNGAIVKGAHLVGLVAGIAAIIMLIIAAIKYVTSGGDPSGTSSAKNTMIYALVGIIVIVLAESIITFVVSRI